MPSRVMSVALRNTRREFVNAMVRVTKDRQQQQQQQQQQQHCRVHVTATAVASIAPGQVFILPFHVGLPQNLAGNCAKMRGGDACGDVEVEVVMLSDDDVEDLKQQQQQQQQQQQLIEPNSNLFWTTLSPPPGARTWGHVIPPPTVRCRGEKNSSFRFT